MASEIVGITFFFITIIVLIVTFFKTRHNERMALISSGRTAKIFDSNDTESNRSLKFGLLLLSLGLGLLVGLFFDNIFDTEPAGVFVSIFAFGGLSLIFYHFYVEKKVKAPFKDEDDIV
ncbi:MAG: hypothetical protein IPN86_05445 [Saprospiraceae bacterium]|nr:hypothetical protein [Saprospiraceae bacterium]